MSWPWPAPVDDGGAAHLTRALLLPDVTLPATDGSAISPRRLPGRCVLFCYPWAGRPGEPNPPDWDLIPGAHGSTPEAEGFRDLHAGFAQMNVAVLGISLQATGEQAEFASRLRLPFPILSDAKGTLQRALRLPVFETGGRCFLKRLTLALRDGRIERVFYPVHPPNAHAREVLAYLGAAVSYAVESRLRPPSGN